MMRQVHRWDWRKPLLSNFALVARQQRRWRRSPNACTEAHHHPLCEASSARRRNGRHRSTRDLSIQRRRLFCKPGFHHERAACWARNGLIFFGDCFTTVSSMTFYFQITCEKELLTWIQPQGSSVLEHLLSHLFFFFLYESRWVDSFQNGIFLELHFFWVAFFWSCIFLAGSLGQFRVSCISSTKTPPDDTISLVSDAFCTTLNESTIPYTLEH